MLALYRHLWHGERSVSPGGEAPRFPHSSRPGSCWCFRVPGDHRFGCKLAARITSSFWAGVPASLSTQAALVIGNVLVFFLLIHLPFGDLRMLLGVALALCLGLAFGVCGAW